MLTSDSGQWLASFLLLSAACCSNSAGRLQPAYAEAKIQAGNRGLKSTTQRFTKWVFATSAVVSDGAVAATAVEATVTQTEVVERVNCTPRAVGAISSMNSISPPPVQEVTCTNCLRCTSLYFVHHIAHVGLALQKVVNDLSSNQQEGLELSGRVDRLMKNQRRFPVAERAIQHRFALIRADISWKKILSNCYCCYLSNLKLIKRKYSCIVYNYNIDHGTKCKENYAKRKHVHSQK